MKFLKICLIVVLIFLFLRILPLVFIYKDSLFSINAKKELVGKIVYDGTELKGSIVIIKLPSGKKIVIPWEIVDYASSVCFSPKGSKIAFTNRKDILYVMNADGSALRQFLNLFPKRIYVSSWSPDGRKIAFVQADGLYVTDINNPYAFRRILEVRLAKDQPAWSPDSQRIAVVSERWTPTTAKVWGKDYPAQIFSGKILIVNIDGTGLRELTSGSDPSWSPDGKEIAYLDADGYYIINADDRDGSSKELIFPTRHPFFKMGVSVPPRWSPDGKYLTVGKKLWVYTDGIYVIPRGNPNNQIWIDADGTNIRSMSWVE